MTTNRSPNYPRVNLRAAIGLVRKIYTQHEKSEFTLQEAATAVGNKYGSGGFQKNIAALRQFGLVQGRGNSVHVTLRGIKLARGDQEGTDYSAVLQQAALAPSLFRELRALGPKSVGALTAKLVTEMNFSEAGAKAVVACFQQTMDFAKVAETPESTETETAEQSHDEEVESQPPQTATAEIQGERTKMSLPLPDGGVALLNLPPAMTIQSWNYFIAVVGALKTGLVQDTHAVEVLQPERPELTGYRVIEEGAD